MKKKTKKYLSLILAIVMCVSFTGFAHASEREPAGIIVNTETGETRPYYSENRFVSLVHPDDQGDSYSANEQAVQPRMSMEVFDHYDPTLNEIDYECWKFDTYRLDNRNLSVPSQLKYKVTKSGTVTGNFTSKFTLSGEAGIVLADISADLGVDLGLSVSFQAGTEYGSEFTVPAGKVGYVDAYVPGATTKGTRVIKVLNTTDESFFYRYKPVSDAKTPVLSQLSLVNRIEDK